MAPKTNQSAFALPEALNESRSEELDKLWAMIVSQGGKEVDGSNVSSLDSEGIRLLLEGLNGPADGLIIRNPSTTLLAAQQALRLEEKISFVPSESPSETFVGRRLGEVLVDLGLIDERRLGAALKTSENQPGVQLGQILVEQGLLEPAGLARGLAAQNGMPCLNPLEDGVLDESLDHGVPFSELRAHGVLPFLSLDNYVAVAVVDPSDVYGVDLIRRRSGKEVLACTATSESIQAGLDRLQRSAASTAGEENTSESIEERFDDVMTAALIDGASDIHLEPSETGWMLRYRVDGRLREALQLATEEGAALMARIKVLAECDISEKRLPQDGRIHFTQGGRDVDIRVSTLPTVFGEKAVLRILDRGQQSLGLEELGIEGANLQTLRQAASTSHGLVLVTGPTGSGKTTTLYSLLEDLVTSETNVATVENPVERSVSGVNQTQVHYKAGLSFAVCLRALLRQDPDIIMIGEIRDRETAEIAVEAALTGHLVLATLHTNDAPGAATRLMQMGVEPFLVAAVLRAVVAQRLVRKLCGKCRQKTEIPNPVRKRYANSGLGKGPHFATKGCKACRETGYDGRRGLFEVMPVDAGMQELLATGPSTGEVRTAAKKSGMNSLIHDALEQVNRGFTTLEEALRAGSAA